MALEELLVSIVSKLNAAGFEELERREKRADKMTRKLSGACGTCSLPLSARWALRSLLTRR